MATRPKFSKLQMAVWNVLGVGEREWNRFHQIRPKHCLVRTITCYYAAIINAGEKIR